MNTVKRYFSAIPPMDMLSRMNPIQRKEWNDFDAELSPEDIIEMQKIDADCNDCRHFKRGPMEKVGGLTKFNGLCLKYNKPTVALANAIHGKGML